MCCMFKAKYIWLISAHLYYLRAYVHTYVAYILLNTLLNDAYITKHILHITKQIHARIRWHTLSDEHKEPYDTVHPQVHAWFLTGKRIQTSFWHISFISFMIWRYTIHADTPASLWSSHKKHHWSASVCVHMRKPQCVCVCVLMR